MVAQSKLFRMISSNFRSPKSLSPKRHQHMPDLRPITIRKHLIKDIQTSRKFNWKAIKEKLQKIEGKSKKNSKKKGGFNPFSKHSKRITIDKSLQVVNNIDASKFR